MRPVCAWYLPAVQDAQTDFPAEFWNLPVPQFGHDPVPALPLSHAAQLSFALLTAQPAPELHEFKWWLLLSCHFALGQFPHTMFALVEQGEVRFSPLLHEPHALHPLCPEVD